MTPTIRARRAGFLESGLPGESGRGLVFCGLYALQHRGQESAGMAVTNGTQTCRLQGHGPGVPGVRRVEAGHLRGHWPSATPATRPPWASWGKNAQPTFRPTRDRGGVALAHNGNLTNTR